jgi:hypothetical protein
MIGGQPIPGIRRQQHDLVTPQRQIVLRHPPIIDHDRYIKDHDTPTEFCNSLGAAHQISVITVGVASAV